MCACACRCRYEGVHAGAYVCVTAGVCVYTGACLYSHSGVCVCAYGYICM